MEGLANRNYKAIVNQIKAIGFNCIRLSFSNQMLNRTSTVVPNAVDYLTNPDLVGLTPLQCMDQIIQYCGLVGIRVILIRVSSKASNAQNEASWYIPGDSYFTEQQYIMDWTMLASRYKGTAVLGGDLWSEPATGTTWGTGLPTDWNTAAERVGNAILTVNPRWILFVQGINKGRDLMCVKSQRVHFSVSNKLVYSVNVYSNDPSMVAAATDPVFPYNLRSVSNKNYGFIVTDQIAPVFVSAIGTFLTSPTDYQLIQTIFYYLNGHGYYLNDDDTFHALPPGHVGISWSFSALNPFGTVSGLLSSDWFTPYAAKVELVKMGMAPLLDIPYVPNADPSHSINNVTSMIYSPSNMPTPIKTATPSQAPTYTRRPTTKPTAIPTKTPKPLMILNASKVKIQIWKANKMQQRCQ